MDKLLQTINGFSGDDLNLLKQLQVELKKQQEVIVKALPQVDAILGSLDPARHALGYLHVLAAKASSNFEPELFIKQTTRFIKECQVKQIRLDPKKFRVVCQKFTDVCRETKQPLRALKPLKTSIWKIGGDNIQVTPQHSMFVQSCILAKNYKAARSVLDKFVFEIDPEATAIESVHTRLYFYYGGIAYIGLKEFAKALEFFEIVISAPAFVASAIMAEAYKKYVLVSLIHRGELAQLPRYTNPQLVRLFKQISAPYEDFATSFSTRSVNDLHKAAENNVELFVKDGNMGLVKQAIQALTRQNIKRLTKTYITLSTSNIADQVNLPNAAETERKVFKMIQDGQVYATINQKDGMVEFHESPDQFNDNKTLDYLDQQLLNAIQLTRHVNQIDDQIGLDQKYIQKILQAERGQGAGPTGGRWPGGPGFGLDEEDPLGMAIDSSQSGPGGFRG